MSDLTFAARKPEISPHGSWKVLIVDDDPGIHAITKTVLRDLIYENRSLDFLSAYSRKEALAILRETDDVALILLDVVMEDDDSGLQLVKDIRETLSNHLVRIVLRTGQPGRAPSQRVIVDYDINDYEEKTELTAQKLFTTVIASLRNYRDLEALEITGTNLEKHRNGLSRIIEASAAMFGTRNPRKFSNVCYRRFLSVTDADEPGSSSFVAFQDDARFVLIAGEGDFTESVGIEPRDILGEDIMKTLRSLKRDDKSLLVQDGNLYLYEDVRTFRLLIHVRDAERYGKLDRQILDIFASNLSVAFDNLRLNREIIDTQEEIMVRLGEVVETRSHGTARHVKRVGEMCGHLARLSGFSEKESYNLKMASSLHDIGKIGTPDNILLKPDKLDEQEFSIIRQHTLIGYDILKDSSKPILKMASGICLEHHERFDGKGYPSGLSGVEIHVNSRIVAICDVFDSLTHDRLHREPWTPHQAAEYLRAETGKAFDPDLLQLFLSDIGEIERILEQYPD